MEVFEGLIDSANDGILRHYVAFGHERRVSFG